MSPAAPTLQVDSLSTEPSGKPHTYTYIHSFFRFFSRIGHQRVLSRVPVLYSRFLLVICFLYSSVYVSISVSQFIPPFCFPLLVTISLFSTFVTLFLFCKYVHLHHFSWNDQAEESCPSAQNAHLKTIQERTLNVFFFFFSFLENFLFYLLLPHSYSTSPASLITTNLFSISVTSFFFLVIITSLLYFFNSTYMQYHIVFLFLCLTYFSQHNASKSIHIAANGKNLFFFWLSNIPLYIHTTSSLSIHLLMYTQVASIS